MQKAKRVCQKCSKPNSSFYPTCNPCRADGCSHTETHIDCNLATVCDQCGTIVQPPKKRVSRNALGKGKRAPWQANGQLTSSAEEAIHAAKL